MPEDPAISLLLEMTDRAFDRASWHGPNLRGSVRGLSATEAAWRPAADRHSVAEQVLHAAYWKYVVRRRLRGDPRGSFPLKGSNWFAAPDPLSVADWRGYVALLEAEHRSLRGVVAGFDSSRLNDPLPGGQGRTIARLMILGIAAHDLYHAGQIQLLKRLRGRGG